MPGRTIRKQIFLVFFIALFLLVARLFYPFLTIILWSTLIYGFVDPIFERFTTRKNGLPRNAFSRSVWAGILSLSGVTILVVPTVFLGVSLVRQVGDIARNLLAAIDARPDLLDLSPSGAIGGFVSRISGGGIDLSSVDLMMEVKHFLSASSGKIIGFSGTLIKNALGLGLTLAFMVFTLYFLLVDGKHLAKVLVGSPPHRSRVLHHVSGQTQEIGATAHSRILPGFTVSGNRHVHRLLPVRHQEHPRPGLAHRRGVVHPDGGHRPGLDTARGHHRARGEPHESDRIRHLRGDIRVLSSTISSDPCFWETDSRSIRFSYSSRSWAA